MIADDHMLFAEAVQAALQGLGMLVTHIVTTGEGAIAEVDRAVPDVIFMDIGLPDQSGLMAGRTILERHPEAKIIALTALSDRSAVEEALRIGFVGYLTKDTPVARFVNAIRSAVDGHLVLPQRLSPTRRRTQAEKDIALMASQLTPREREVLTLLVRGADGRRAAAELGISLNTVRTHVQSILTKLQVHSRLEAATFAVRHGIVDISGPDEGREAG
ncbi:MAG TPA: response regulator transcription factor [Actinomycetota bacterium]|nr:response regulator transcription factor [Actinomycetota bacterium]